MKYFVTGAGGFVGVQLCRTLVGKGNAVSGLVYRFVPEELELLGVRLCRGSVEHFESYRAELMDSDYVVHLAGDARYGNGPQYRVANVEMTACLIRAVKEYGTKVKRVVFVSTVGVVDRSPADPCRVPLTESTPPLPTSDYGRSKLEAEQLVAGSGVPFSIVRPTLVVGNEMRANSHVAVFARAALAGSLLGRVSWPGAVSVIHVSDLAEGIVVAAEHPDAAGKILFAAGEPVKIRDILEWAAPRGFRFPAGWLAYLLRAVPSMVPFSGKVMLYPALTANDQILRTLGWIPRWSGEQAIAEVIEREKRRVNLSLPLAGKTVVTGAASGLGLALTKQLGKMGRRLILIDRDKVGLEAVASGLSNCATVCCDLGDTAAVERLLSNPIWLQGPIDELFACAGFGLRGAVAMLPLEVQSAIFRVNVVSRLQLMHRLVQIMRRRQFGRIVLISSSSAFQALPFMAVYAASNAAVKLLGEAMAAELQEEGIEVLTVCPGGMQTGFQKRAQVQELPNESLMLPEKVAAEILAALGRNRALIMPSTRSKVMSLAARLLPQRVSLALWYRLMKKFR